MTDFIFYTNPTLTIVCVPAGALPAYSLEDAAFLTGVHPDMVRYYWRLGLLESDGTATDGAPTFDEDALEEIRRIEHYRRHFGVSRRALPQVRPLWLEVERLHLEVRRRSHS